MTPTGSAISPRRRVDAEDLYGLGLDRFVPERNELARSLRKQGRREEASEVAALRKPSVAAWAVNQLVRTQRQPIAELFDAGDGLREAHHNVVSGHGDGGTLADAVRQEREAVDALLTAARGLLNSDGHELTAAMVERVSDTLHAAALDPDARAMVRGGRLEHELRHVGLGEGLEVGEPVPRRADRKQAIDGQAGQGKAERAGREQAQREQADRARAERERAERERAKARRAAEAQARRKLARAERALQLAQERRDRAAEALREADEQLASAQAEADAAARELE